MSTTTRRLTLLLALLLALAACGGQNTAEGEGGGTTAEDTGGGGSTESTDGTAATAEGGSGGTLDFTWGTNASSVYDPHITSNPFVNIFLYPAYDRLFDLDENGEVVPMLASEFEFNDDATVLTVTLRDDVTFHDGEPFDAETVVANIERAQTLENSTVVPDLAAVESVTAVDPTTVEFGLSGPTASLPALLADRAGMMISPAAFENPDLDLMPVGAGPYQAVEHEPGNVISYEPFEGYYAPDVQTLDRLNLFMQLDPQTRLNALQSGEIDATTLNADQIADAESAGLQVETQDLNSVFLMYLNKGSEPLANEQVRQALMHAFDREAIADTLFAGECDPTVQVLPSAAWGHNEDIGPDAYPYDPERARQLLAEAGYGDGFDMSTVVVNVPFYVAGAEVLQAQLAEVGITLDVRSLEPAQLLSTFVTGESDAYYSQWPGAVDPAKTVASLLLEQSFLNPGGLAVPEIDEQAGAALATTERSERADHYAQAMQAMVDSAFHIPICSPKGILATSGDVQGLQVDQGGSPDFRGVSLAA